MSTITKKTEIIEKITTNNQEREIDLSLEIGEIVKYLGKSHFLSSFELIPEDWSDIFQEYDIFKGDYESGILLQYYGTNPLKAIMARYTRKQTETYS